ncbi:MAG: PAS domain-containing protein [Spirochaetales bacterium]|nr:PAS domain-containing protein [Spirochaetales bacterium]
MTRSRRLVTAVYVSFFAVFAVTLAAALLYALLSFRPYLYRLRTEDLEQRARLIEPQVAPLLQLSPAVQMRQADAVCVELGRRGGFRVTLILPDGTVIGDSERDPSGMEDHGTRAEILEALRGEVGVQVRHSATLGREMLYVALPVRQGGAIAGVLRVSLPRLSVEDALRDWRAASLWVGLAALLASAALVALLSRRIARPVGELQEGTERILARSLEERLRLPRFAETNAIAEALNHLDDLLDEQAHTVTRQQSQEQAILRSMSEGVLAIDPDKRVIDLNEAAARMLKVRLEDARGSRVEEVVRVPALLSFIERTMAGEPSLPADESIVLYLDEPRSIQAQGAVLRGPDEEILGYLVVLNDVTHLRRLERIRSDFVANVSHELRTPITTIKGFAETLLDEGLEDREEGLRFLGMISRESRRLESLVEDLLSLARIEHEGERREILFARGALRPILRQAAEACAEAAEKAGVAVDVQCAEDLEAELNPLLLKQALVNLIDNAVKFSRRGGKVEVACGLTDGEIMLQVRDRGPGIAPEHLPRLFERFYRVDKARSRSLGGTGLGLAIVKHIAAAHRGRVAVESTPGTGSTFSIILPVGTAAP